MDVKKRSGVIILYCEQHPRILCLRITLRKGWQRKHMWWT